MAKVSEYNRGKSCDVSMNTIVILQRLVADYRLGFYRALAAELGSVFMVTTGDDKFTQALTKVDPNQSWLLPVKNIFFAGNALLWQSGQWNTICKARLVIAELNPRIVSTWVLIILRRIAGRPTMLWGHSTSMGPRSAIVGRLRFWQCQLADAILAYTDTQAGDFRKRLPQKNIFVAANACLGRDDCAPVSAETAHHVVYVGRLIEEKKVGLLINGFARALPNLPDNTSLLLVGSGPALETLKSQVESLGISSRVMFAGHINEPQRLRSIYERSICAVSPGYIGLSAMQALGFGVPLLVADKEFHSPEIEACKSEKTCLFFKSDDSESLANGLRRFYAQREQWETRRPLISRFISEHYSFETMAKQFAEAIRSVTASPRCRDSENQ
jgi:glycosyltransferase involved in cell wall biosynthesis